MLLEIKNLHKHFGGIHALNDVSVKIAKGSVVGIVGDNGAGKSTLMKCISGAYSADSGEIYFEDLKLAQADPKRTRSLGIEMIYQDLNLCPQQDVVSNIFLGCELQKKLFRVINFLDKKKMREEAGLVLSRLNADVPLETAAGRLSGGQQQAVAIARAMLYSPKLVIMDEPTAALAVREVDKVCKLVKALKAQGVSVIIISHRLADIFEVADRIVVMRRGEIREDKAIGDTNIKEITSFIIGE